MIKVTPKKNEKIAVTLKRFRKLCEREGVMKEIKKREAYEKPSERRRRKKRKSIRQSPITNF